MSFRLLAAISMCLSSHPTAPQTVASLEQSDASQPRFESPAPPPMPSSPNLDEPASVPTSSMGGVPLQLWLPGTNAWGSSGGMHFDAAHGLRRQGLVINIVAEVGHASSLFVPNDSALVNRERLAVAWAPIEGLEVGLSETFTYNQWSTYIDATIASFGDPTLHAKYSRDINERWAWGAALTWLMPTAVNSSGLVLKASTLTLAALGSYKPFAHLELTANLGIVIDGSSSLGASVAPNKRFVYQINTGSGAWVGVAAISQWMAADALALSPFVELGGLARSRSDFSSNPLAFTVGLKAYFPRWQLLEVTVGTDVRLVGAPQMGGDYPGIFPWMAFAALSVHVFNSQPAEAYARPCHSDQGCARGQRCVQQLCRYTTEVTRVQTVKRKSFTVVGVVLDDELKRPIEGAQVLFTGFDDTPVAVDLKTGKYRSFPLDAGEGLLQMRVVAPNYKPFERTLDRSVTGQEINVDVALRKAERPDVGTLKGNLKDARTGAPVLGGKIVLVTLSKSIAVSDNGQFSGEVEAGHHDVLVVAPGYVTQHKRISVHDADVIILNVDMRRARKSNAAKDVDHP